MRVESGKLGLYKPNGEKLLTYEEDVAAQQAAEEKPRRLADKL